jgi:hypothetical protein
MLERVPPLASPLIAHVAPINTTERMFDDVFADSIAECLPGFTICPKMNATEHASVYYLLEGRGKAWKTAHLSGEGIICHSNCRVLAKVV